MKPLTKSHKFYTTHYKQTFVFTNSPTKSHKFYATHYKQTFVATKNRIAHEINFLGNTVNFMGNTKQETE